MKPKKVIASVIARQPPRTLTLAEWREWQQQEHERMVDELVEQLLAYFEGRTDGASVH